MDNQTWDDEKLWRELKKAAARELGFLLMGRTGVGKSSTINSLLGEQIAPTGDFVPTTIKVEPYKGTVGDIRVNIVDTPGLCDDLPEKRKDRRYIHKIRDAAPVIDCVWFVTRLDDPRVTGDEMRAIKLISKSFENIWDRAIIIFTHAGAIPPEKFAMTLETRAQLIRNEIARYTGEQIARQVPAVAVENTSLTTPNGEPWLPELFTLVVERISQDGMVPFVLAMAKSVGRKRKKRTEDTKEENPPKAEEKTASKPASSFSESYRIEMDDRQADRVQRRTENTIIGEMARRGEEIGRKYAGSFGAAVGKVVGTAVGFFKRLLG